MILLNYQGFTYSESFDEHGKFISIDGCKRKWGIIIIPHSINGLPVRKIGNAAFMESEIQKVVIPEGVEYIDQQAFRFCLSLKDAVLPSTLIEINNEAFEGSGITDVSFGSNLKTIGKYAFNSCEYLNSIVLPNNLTSVGYGAFDGCDSLKSLHIGENVVSFDSDENVLSYCTSLKHLTVSAKNPKFFSVNNMLITRDGCLLRCSPAVQQSSLTVPKQVKKIAEG